MWFWDNSTNSSWTILHFGIHSKGGVGEEGNNKFFCVVVVGGGCGGRVVIVFVVVGCAGVERV